MITKSISVLLCAVVVLMLAFPAGAIEIVDTKELDAVTLDSCNAETVVKLNANMGYFLHDSSGPSAKKLWDSKLEKIQEIATSLGIETLELATMNYGYNKGPQYTDGSVSKTIDGFLQGSVTYSTALHDMDKAVKLVDALGKEGIQMNMTVQRYRNKDKKC